MEFVNLWKGLCENFSSDSVLQEYWDIVIRSSWMLTSQVVIDAGISEYELLQKARNHFTVTYEM